ncbi:MAG: exosome complex RNA-binding protein Csl4 [Candidatus Helarchaeota archaeon]
MSSIKDRIGKIVLPGEKIGVIEQFLPGEGTYEEDGIIYASLIGSLKLNKRERVVSVEPEKDTPLPRDGDVVIGRVDTLKKQSVVVYVNDARSLQPRANYEASIHVSNVSRDYIENISDAFKPYDLVRCRLIRTDSFPFQAVTDEKNLGVILAFCSICGEKLAWKGNRLVCSNCRNIEQRKVASDYGRMQL